jgi:hypothetical protein
VGRNDRALHRRRRKRDLVGLVTADLYDAAKKWARNRYGAKKAAGSHNPRPEIFTIYVP